MWFRDLERADRTVVVVIGVVASALILGLAVTGVWQFLFHEPDRSWETYVVGGDKRPLPRSASGVADVHGALGDIAAASALLIGAWVSYRLLARVSLVAVTSVVLLFGGILTGGVIAFRAVARDGVVDVDTAGYAQLFRGDVDTVITDTSDLGVGIAAFWTSVHVATVPILVGVIFVAGRQARKRRANAPAADPSWLDQLES